MIKVKQCLLTISFCVHLPVTFAQPDLKWDQYYTGVDYQVGMESVTDEDGNVYTCGMDWYGPVAPGMALIVRKYSNNGTMLWECFFGDQVSPSSLEPEGYIRFEKGSPSFVYVSMFDVYNGSVVKKLNSNDGSVLWTHDFYFPGRYLNLLVDDDLYLTGKENGTCIVRKLNKMTGNLVWEDIYVPTAQYSSSEGLFLAVKDNDLFIAGTSNENPALSYIDYYVLLIKYDKISGNRIWLRTHHFNPVNQQTRLKVGGLHIVGDSVYIAGMHDLSVWDLFDPNYNYLTYKQALFMTWYDFQGTQIAAKTYARGHNLEHVSSFEKFGQNLYLIGGVRDYISLTIEYLYASVFKVDPIGNEIWSFHDDTLSVSQQYNCGDFDSKGNLVLGKGVYANPAHIVYLSYEGQEIWDIQGEEPAQDSDFRDVDVYNDSNIFITGSVRKPTSTWSDMLTSKYRFDVFPNCGIITASLSSVNADCSGQSSGGFSVLAEGGSGVYSYSLTSSDGTTVVELSNVEDMQDFNGLVSDLYILSIVDSSGCSGTESVVIDEFAPPEIDIVPDSGSIELGETMDLQVTGGNVYEWSASSSLSCNDCETPLASPDITTHYHVTGWDTVSGCEGKDSILITVIVIDTDIEVLCGEVFVPTIFSPNADGENDVFWIRGKNMKEVRLAIFDRWGEKVFATDGLIPWAGDKTIGWDGKFRGKLMNTAVFVYMSKWTCLNGEGGKAQGNITLVR